MGTGSTESTGHMVLKYRGLVLGGRLVDGWSMRAVHLQRALQGPCNDHVTTT